MSKKGFKKPCFKLFTPENGFHSHVLQCSEKSPEEWNCDHLFTGRKWVTCEIGGRSHYLKDYRDWQEEKGNRCPHCGC